MSALSRLWCRLFGHRWSTPSYAIHDEHAAIMVCTRTACRGRPGATWWIGVE